MPENPPGAQPAPYRLRSASEDDNGVVTSPSAPPRISVVIPALDEAVTIGRCLRSLAEQDYAHPFEVVVVDNGSTDATADIALAHGARVVHEPERGVCRARQRGTEAALGQIVVSTDADTAFPRTWLSQIAATLDAQPETVATCGPCEYSDGPWWARPYTTTIFGVTAWIHRRTSRVIYASATNIAFRRSAWTGYDLHLNQGGDELGLLRSLRRRGPIHFDPDRVTVTSPRRLARGLVYNVFVTCLYFYFGAYLLNRITGRTVLGSAPAIRPDGSADDTTSGAVAGRRRAAVTFGAAAAAVVAWWLVPFDVV